MLRTPVHRLRSPKAQARRLLRLLRGADVKKHNVVEEAEEFFERWHHSPGELIEVHSLLGIHPTDGPETFNCYSIVFEHAFIHIHEYKDRYHVRYASDKVDTAIGESEFKPI